MAGSSASSSSSGAGGIGILGTLNQGVKQIVSAKAQAVSAQIAAPSPAGGSPQKTLLAKPGLGLGGGVLLVAVVVIGALVLLRKKG